MKVQRLMNSFAAACLVVAMLVLMETQKVASHEGHHHGVPAPAPMAAHGGGHNSSAAAHSMPTFAASSALFAAFGFLVPLTWLWESVDDLFTFAVFDLLNVVLFAIYSYRWFLGFIIDLCRYCNASSTYRRCSEGTEASIAERASELANAEAVAAQPSTISGRRSPPKASENERCNGTELGRPHELNMRANLRNYELVPHEPNSLPSKASPCTAVSHVRGAVMNFKTCLIVKFSKSRTGQARKLSTLGIPRTMNVTKMEQE
ncbi:hypothetical protein Scep_018054 [Stephania cephalantha]|uniref:MARVEL domain-containing protein n=1 Tax=Stephania cephalantha TaxID=152367 RepID=A0AAP0IQQ5_9MAGN